jgi:hypothetical protein
MELLMATQEIKGGPAKDACQSRMLALSRCHVQKLVNHTTMRSMTALSDISSILKNLMERSSPIIKNLSERSNLLFGGVVAAIVTVVADRAQLLPPEIPRIWLYMIYLAGTFCAGALFYGLVAFASVPAAKLAKEVIASFNRRANGPNAFRNLLPAHKDTLVYLMARDQKSFPAEYMYRLLEEMRHHGLLVREQGVTFHSESSYYSVPDEIWREMRRLKWPSGQPVPEHPPWIMRNRRT